MRAAVAPYVAVSMHNCRDDSKSIADERDAVNSNIWFNLIYDLTLPGFIDIYYAYIKYNTTGKGGDRTSAKIKPAPDRAPVSRGLHDHLASLGARWADPKIRLSGYDAVPRFEKTASPSREKR